jgi:glutamate racemase
MPFDNRPIAFFDSGVGGLPYLEAARHLMPAEQYVYLADRAGFPYGTKDAGQVVALATAAIRMLVSRTAPKALVVACNTATELAIDEIRRENPDIAVVGTVPALKLAVALTRNGRIGIVATPAAATAHYLERLAMEWAADCAVIKRGDGDLVNFVENRFIGSTHADRLDAVRPSVSVMLDAGVDTIVLGCTHFVHLAAEFKEVAGEAITIVDSRNGVISRLESVLKNYRHDGTPASEDSLYLTGKGEPGPVHSGFAFLFGLRFAGVLV